MTDNALIVEAEIIKNETATGANTADRIGAMFEDIISNKINNDKIDIDGNLAANSDDLVPSQKAVKFYVEDRISNKISNDKIDIDGNLAANSNDLVPSQKAVKFYVDTRVTSPYKSYCGLLSQIVGDPTVIVIKNDFIGVTIDWSINSTGIYIANANQPIFTANKTLCFFTTDGSNPKMFGMSRLNDTSVVLITTDGNFTPLDYLNQSSFEIRVYP